MDSVKFELAEGIDPKMLDDFKRAMLPKPFVDQMGYATTYSWLDRIPQDEPAIQQYLTIIPPMFDK